MKKPLIFFISLLFISQLSAQELDSSKYAFENPIIAEGGKESIVHRIESAVIIPGDTHEDLWVHPELMTIPGDPVVIEFRARTTDRRGGDRHASWHYFKTDNYFNTLQPLAEPTDSIWKRKDLSIDDLAPPANEDPELPEQLGHTWGAHYVYLDSKTILQPFTTQKDHRNFVQSLVARFQNEGLVPLHISNSWSKDTGRGLYEPHIALYKGVCYMTARAETGRGYIMVSEDKGRTWNSPKPWTWDNGDEIPMNQTMTKLLSHSDGLTLVYTRIRKDNDNVFRNRAPLHIADIDPTTLSLKRSTERIIVPNQSTRGKGLPVGNFWVWPINQEASYVVVAEWPRDGRKENGDIWLAKIKWKHLNQKMTPKGVERIPLK